LTKQFVPAEAILTPLLVETADRHQHLCPRQVLGVRLGLYGLRLLGLVDEIYQPRFVNEDKRLLTFVETDGCGTDGIVVATNCTVGQRTLRVLDYGKMAATLVDTRTNKAIRLSPHPNSRHLAQSCSPDAESRWHAYRQAYQVLPDEAMMVAQVVQLQQPLTTIISHPEARAICEVCGEEIMNEREVVGENGRVLCQSCTGNSYYQ
jgi:formylmethanofuran dehydrogenase subunit E